MFASGAILLLSGLFAITYGVDAILSPNPELTIAFLILLGLLVGFAGAMLIWATFRGRPS